MGGSIMGRRRLVRTSAIAILTLGVLAADADRDEAATQVKACSFV